jgi:hypothetical protein
MNLSDFRRLRSNLAGLIRRPLHPQAIQPASGQGPPAASEPRPATPAIATGHATLRSPEEVRAALARLRATSKERHAAVSVPRQESFDDAVFANFSLPPSDPAPTSKDQVEYPKTVHLPRAASKTKPTR